MQQHLFIYLFISYSISSKKINIQCFFYLADGRIYFDSFYRLRNACWLQSPSLIWGFLLPLGILLLINFIIFAILVKEVILRKQNVSEIAIYTKYSITVKCSSIVKYKSLMHSLPSNSTILNPPLS